MSTAGVMYCSFRVRQRATDRWLISEADFTDPIDPPKKKPRSGIDPRSFWVSLSELISTEQSDTTRTCPITHQRVLLSPRQLVAMRFLPEEYVVVEEKHCLSSFQRQTFTMSQIPRNFTEHLKSKPVAGGSYSSSSLPCSPPPQNLF
jgi:hypothetical protein